VRRIALRRERQNLTVSSLGLRVVGELERAVRNNDPGGAADLRSGAWIGINDPLSETDSGAVVFHLVRVIGRCSKDCRRFLMVRNRVGKLEPTGDHSALYCVPLVIIDGGIQLLTMCIDCGVARGRRLNVWRVFVSRPLILLRGIGEIPVLEEKTR